MRSFDLQMIANKRTKKPVVHISLNPDPRDTVDDETAKLIAQEYLDKMGYGKQPYILYKHQDIERTHYHIVTVCVDENGDKISDQFSKKKSMEACREIEKKYNLHIPTKAEMKKEYQVKPVDYTKGDIQKQIKNTIGALISTYNIPGFSEYRTLLEQFGCTYTQTEGRIEREPIHGILYSAIDENGNKHSNPIKSSLFGKEYGYESLKRKFKNDEEKYKANKKTNEQQTPSGEAGSQELTWQQKLQIRKDRDIERQRKNTDFTRRTIIQCMNRCKSRSKEELTGLLKKKNIDMVLFINKENRVYGITFIDHNTRSVMNGSKIGKEFTANYLSNFFSNPYFIIPSSNETPAKEKDDPEEQPFEALFSLLALPEGSDPDELIRRKKKNNDNLNF